MAHNLQNTAAHLGENLQCEGLIDREAQPNYGAIPNMDRNNNNPNHRNHRRWLWFAIILILAIIVIIIVAIFFVSHWTTHPPQIESIFGGMYSVAEESVYSVPNHYTDDLNCPLDYTSNTVAYFNACYQCGAVHLYLCLKENLSSDPRKLFGGIYSTNNCNGMEYGIYINPLTDTHSCAKGYESHLIIASQTDDFCNVNVYGCFNEQKALDYYNIGGFYTEYTTSNGCVSCVKRNVNNAMVKALSCPDYYDRIPLAYTYSPDGYVGCPGCNGMAYICEIPRKKYSQYSLMISDVKNEIT